MTREEFVVRIIVCLVLSIFIGLERQYRNGVVGLRTNVLVAIGAFMFNYATFAFATHDESRIAASVVSGIGFLGAGIIVLDGNKIKGLNTAATLWCVAAIGTLTCIGMLYEACIGTGLVLLSNILLRFISFIIMDRLQVNFKEKCEVKINCKIEGEADIRNDFSRYIERNKLNLISMEREQLDKEEVNLNAVIVTSRPMEVEIIVQNISANPNVYSISWKHNKYYHGDDEDASLENEYGGI